MKKIAPVINSRLCSVIEDYFETVITIFQYP